MAEVKLENLTKIYGNKTVVDHINLTVKEGTLTSILGPSGCGKSTTLRMIAGFEEPQDGDIYFDGESVSSVPVNKREIGMVFQSYALFPHMTVFQNVAYGLEQRKIKGNELKKRVNDALKMVHMEEYSNRKPKQLSGGQQQRVALARALVIRPRVLLLDECLSALDKKLRVEMQVELRRILEECQVTTFFVTHDQEEAMTLSDSIVVMNDGKIEQTGDPHTVYEKPVNRFVAGFLGKANFFSGIAKSSGSGYAEITMEDGSVIRIPAIAASSTDQKKHKVTYAVRPEKIEIVKESDFSGTIAGITYSGNTTSYIVTTPSGEITVEQRSAEMREGLHRGDVVHLLWNPEDAVLLEDQ